MPHAVQKPDSQICTPNEDREAISKHPTDYSEKRRQWPIRVAVDEYGSKHECEHHSHAETISQCLGGSLRFLLSASGGAESIQSAC
jgi:hypothetical protein